MSVLQQRAPICLTYPYTTDEHLTHSHSKRRTGLPVSQTLAANSDTHPTDLRTLPVRSCCQNVTTSSCRKIGRQRLRPTSYATDKRQGIFVVSPSAVALNPHGCGAEDNDKRTVLCITPEDASPP